MTQRTAVLFVNALSTTLERALSTVQNLLSQLSDEEDFPESFGCRHCGLIYEPQLYRPGWVQLKEWREEWPYCPACGQNVVKFGPLPGTVETPSGFYLADGSEELLGPYKSQEETNNHLWEWFDRKREHGDKEDHKEKGHEETLGENKIIDINSPGKSQAKNEEGQ